MTTTRSIKTVNGVHLDRFRARDFLDNPDRERLTTQERGVLALVEGLDTYTSHCAPAYADACNVIEFGIGQMFRTARYQLNYAPETLRRGALDHHLAELMRAWHVDPDTEAWTGDDNTEGGDR